MFELIFQGLVPNRHFSSALFFGYFGEYNVKILRWPWTCGLWNMALDCPENHVYMSKNPEASPIIQTVFSSYTMLYTSSSQFFFLDLSRPETNSSHMKLETLAFARPVSFCRAFSCRNTGHRGVRRRGKQRSLGRLGFYGNTGHIWIYTWIFQICKMSAFW